MKYPGRRNLLAPSDAGRGLGTPNQIFPLRQLGWTSAATHETAHTISPQPKSAEAKIDKGHGSRFWAQLSSSRVYFELWQPVHLLALRS